MAGLDSSGAAAAEVDVDSPFKARDSEVGPIELDPGEPGIAEMGMADMGMGEPGAGAAAGFAATGAETAVADGAGAAGRGSGGIRTEEGSSAMILRMEARISSMLGSEAASGLLMTLPVPRSRRPTPAVAAFAWLASRPIGAAARQDVTSKTLRDRTVRIFSRGAAAILDRLP